MPTIGVYVSMPVARAIAKRWGISPNEPPFQEVVRSIVADKLDEVAGFPVGAGKFATDCENVAIHKPGFRCRLCGGSG